MLYCKGNGMGAYQGGTCNETDISVKLAYIAPWLQTQTALAKPGMGVDEGYMLCFNEMQRILAIKNRGDLLAIRCVNPYYSVYFAPRGARRMLAIGRQIAQQHLDAQDRLIGLMGEAGSGKSLLIKGMFPGLNLLTTITA